MITKLFILIRKILKMKMFDRTFMILQEVNEGYFLVSWNLFTYKEALKEKKELEKHHKNLLIVKIYLD